MKRWAILILIPWLAGCEALTIPREPAAILPQPVRPTRLVMIFFDALARDKEFVALNARAARFSHAYVGHLTATPEVSAAVAATGRFTRNLPFCDGVVRSGGALKKITELSPRAFTRMIAPLEKSLLATRLIAAMPGGIVAAAGKPGLARIMGGSKAEVIAVPDPTLLVDKFTARLAAAGNWRVAMALLGTADADAAVAKVMAAMPSDAVVVISALAGVAPAGLALAPDAAKRALATLDDADGSRFWLKNEDPVEIAKFAASLRSNAIDEIYTKQDTGNAVHYIRAFRAARMRGDAYKWAADRAQELVESSACRSTASVVAASADTLEASQRIPLYVIAPGLMKYGSSDVPVRLVDIAAMVMRIFELPLPEEADGDSNPFGAFVRR